MKYKKEQIEKVNSIMRFIDRLKNYDNKKAFNDYMKRKEILNKLWLFAKIDLMCWIIYFASVILILLMFYQDVPPGERDYTVISWTQHIIFFIA